jgi:hypothetical protein
MGISRRVLGRLGKAVGVASLALALVAPSGALAAPTKGTASVGLRYISDCIFEADYIWSGFGGAGLPAYGVVTMYFREPGQADQIVDFSQQSDSAGQNAKAGELLYRFNDKRSWFVSVGPSADARIVVVGELIATPKHRDGYLVTGARAESNSLALPAACTT